METKEVKKRGLLGRFCLLREHKDPLERKQWEKRLILAQIAMITLQAPMAQTTVVPALPTIQKDLNVSAAMVNNSVAFYAVALGIFPILWSSFSERYGRRNAYIYSSVVFVAASMVCGFSTNIGVFLAFRLLQAVGTSAPQSVGGGTIADIFPRAERGRAMGLFLLGPQTGAILGGIIGGALSEAWGWRSIFWFTTVLAVLQVFMLIFFLPETFPEDATRPFTILTPFKGLLLLRIVPIGTASMLSATVLAPMYSLFLSLTHQLQAPPYNFNALQVGAANVPNAIGLMIGGVLSGRYSDYILSKQTKKFPEVRLKAILPGCILLPIVTLWYGFTITNVGGRVYIPLIATFFFGISVASINVVLGGYFVDLVPKRSSTLSAIFNFCRMITVAIFTATYDPWSRAVGIPALFGMLVGIMVLMMACMVLVYVKRDRWAPQIAALNGVKSASSSVTLEHGETPDEKREESDLERGGLERVVSSTSVI